MRHDGVYVDGKYVELEVALPDLLAGKEMILGDNYSFLSPDELATIVPIPEVTIMPTKRDLDYAGMTTDDLIFWAFLWAEYAAVHGLSEEQRADVALIEQLIAERQSVKSNILKLVTEFVFDGEPTLTPVELIQLPPQSILFPSAEVDTNDEL